MRTLVIAPHPDDELLGCGGTLLKRVAQGHTVGVLFMTTVTTTSGWSNEQIIQRSSQISRVTSTLGIHQSHIFKLDYPTTQLDQVPLGELVQAISHAVHTFKPTELLLPHFSDAHSDHRVTFDAASTCTKWFRYPFIRRVLAYDTVSETDQSLAPYRSFHPNLFIDITPFLDQKLELLSIYQSEIKPHPFPRSLETVKAKALLIGSMCGCNYAESFQLLRQFE